MPPDPADELVATDYRPPLRGRGAGSHRAAGAGTGTGAGASLISGFAATVARTAEVDIPRQRGVVRCGWVEWYLEAAVAIESHGSHGQTEGPGTVEVRIEEGDELKVGIEAQLGLNTSVAVDTEVLNDLAEAVRRGDPRAFALRLLRCVSVQLAQWGAEETGRLTLQLQVGRPLTFLVAKFDVTPDLLPPMQIGSTAELQVRLHGELKVHLGLTAEAWRAIATRTGPALRAFITRLGAMAGSGATAAEGAAMTGGAGAVMGLLAMIGIPLAVGAACLAVWAHADPRDYELRTQRRDFCFGAVLEFLENPRDRVQGFQRWHDYGRDCMRSAISRYSRATLQEWFFDRRRRWMPMPADNPDVAAMANGLSAMLAEGGASVPQWVRDAVAAVPAPAT